MAENFDVIVIGGGAAGLMCAIEAGKRGRSTLVLEHNDRIGKKILISGGGRCNFTNLSAGPENYLSVQPDFCKSALARYRSADFIALVEKHGIAYHEKKLGQLFCDKSSREIVQMLEVECIEAKVKIITRSRVGTVRKDGDEFIVESNGEELRCASLIIASGGLSLPNLGVSDFAYRIAKQFGLNVTALRAGLVPLTFGGNERAFCRELSGLSLPCEVRYGAQRFRENLLFTHKGMSGPAILQISSYWREGDELEINLLPEEKDPVQWLTDQRQREVRLDNLLAERWPKRFAEAWSELAGETRPLRAYAGPELVEIGKRIREWKLKPAGTEGYTTAEVTCGGVDVSELHSKTMAARAVPGLYFIGESVDVTGWLGGYNFQWAWASGAAAGQAA